MARLSPLTAQRHGVQRARMLLAHRVKPLAMPTVEVPKRHPAGAGAFHLDATTTGGLLIGDGVEVVLDNSLARPLLPRGSSTPAIHARAPRLGRAQRRWGGSTPNHPAALQTGMQMGFEPPEQHEQSTNQIVSWLAPNTTSRDTPEGGSSSSRGCERRSLRWLLNFRLDMVWDAETTRNLAELPPDNQGAYRGLLQCPT